MPFIQPKTNNYFGLTPVSAGPYNANFSVNPYLVSSSEGSQINIGDIVVMTSKATVRVPTSGGAFTNTSSFQNAGVAASILAANAGSTGATLTANSSQMVWVWDNPEQVFAITDSSSGLIARETGLGKNYKVLTTGVIGSSGPLQIGNLGISNMALSGVESSVTGTLHLIGMHPIEGGNYSTLTTGSASSTDNRKWLVTWASHFLMQSTVALTTVINTSS